MPHYLDNKQFTATITRYLEIKDQPDHPELTQVSDRLANDFYQIAFHLQAYFPDCDHSELIQLGVAYAWERVDRFHPSKGKAFNYFTTILINVMKKSLSTANRKKAHEMKYMLSKDKMYHL